MLKHKRAIGLLVLCLCLLAPVWPAAADDDSLTHTVVAGETLFRIALRYGVDMNELAQLNNITDVRRIYAGQVLHIPGLTLPDSSPEVANPLVAASPTVHVIQRGETLQIIANRYGITVQEILDANEIPNPNRIYAGQQLNLWLPETAVPAAASPDVQAAVDQAVQTGQPIVHVVQPGEHLSQIGRMYGVNWHTLAQVNNITNPDRVFAGTQLTIPLPGTITDLGIMTPMDNGPGPRVGTGREIVVVLSTQRIYAYENGVLQRSAIVSTGLPATPTVQGEYAVYRKLDSQTMSGPGYSLPNVQWVMYFYQAYAIHGTYWHNNFGQPMSRGCVNLTNDEAYWFYNFASIGTPVYVRY